MPATTADAFLAALRRLRTGDEEAKPPSSRGRGRERPTGRLAPPGGRRLRKETASGCLDSMVGHTRIELVTPRVKEGAEGIRTDGASQGQSELELFLPSCALAALVFTIDVPALNELGPPPIDRLSFL